MQDEVGGVRQCAGRLDHLEAKPYPPAADLRPDGDFPDTCAVPIRLPEVAAILRRIAFDVDELARARRVDDLQVAKVVDDPRAERRRRLAEEDLTYAAFCDRTGTPWRSTLQGDTLKVTRLDRLSRSVLHLVTLGAEMVSGHRCSRISSSRSTPSSPLLRAECP